MTSRPTGPTTANALVAQPKIPHGTDSTSAPATQQVKTDFWRPGEWEALPQQLAQYGIAEVPTEVRAWHEFLHECNYHDDATNAPPPKGDHSEVFTDGGCHLPHDQWLKSGAWAVVQATPTGFHTLHSQRLTGVLQGSDRAEVYAIQWACRWAALHQHTINIRTDYAPAIATWQTITQTQQVTPDLPHADLWQTILPSSNNEPFSRCTKSTATRNDLPTRRTFGRGRANRQASYALEEWLPDEEEIYTPAVHRAKAVRHQVRRAQEYIIKATNAFSRQKQIQQQADTANKRQKTGRGLEQAHQRSSPKAKNDVAKEKTPTPLPKPMTTTLASGHRRSQSTKS